MMDIPLGLNSLYLLRFLAQLQINLVNKNFLFGKQMMELLFALELKVRMSLLELNKKINSNNI